MIVFNEELEQNSRLQLIKWNVLKGQFILFSDTFELEGTSRMQA